MIVDAENVERAVRRWWFTYEADDGKPLGQLTSAVQAKIFDVALELQRELCTQERS